MKEIWKNIDGLDGKYQCSNRGRIKRINKHPNISPHRILKCTKDKDGYVVTNPMHGIYLRVHHVVALLFVPNPHNKPYPNHKNLIKDDNDFENLEWSTASENSLHAQAHGRLGRMHVTVENIKTGEVYTSIKKMCIENNFPYKYVAKMIKKNKVYKDYKTIGKVYRTLFQVV